MAITINGQIYRNLQEQVKYLTDKINESLVNIPEIVQTTGGSETAVMSQKAVTDNVNSIKSDIDNIKKIVLVKNELSLKRTDFTVGSLQTSLFTVDVTKTHALTYMKHIEADTNDVIKITVPVINGVYYKYRFGFYDESKAYIGQEAFTTENPYIITQKNTKYIAFCIIAYNQADDTPHSNLIDEFSETDIIKFENLSKPVATMEDIVSDIAELQNKKRVYRQMVDAAMKPKNITSNGYLSQLQPLALFHFSDIHGDAIETNRIGSVFQDIVDKCDDVICTGDIVELRYSNDATFMTDGSSSKNYLLAIGNHDVLTDESGFDFTQRATQAQQYAKFFAPNIANWGVTYTSNKTYYYKDYSAKKIRFIVLNNMLTSTDATEQLTWLETTLADAITNDYSVVIGMHYPVYGFTKIDCAFTRRDREIPPSDCADISICQKVQTFIDDGGDFICYIGGHKHGDYIGYSSAYPSQISILVDSASRAQSNQYSDLMRVDGEISQDLYNVVVLDKSISAIKIIRIGCDVDNYMRRRDMICLDYHTKEILSYGLPVYTGGVQ